MSYRVVWAARAREIIDTHYFLASEKGGDALALRVAVSRIETQLAADPTAVGESRDDGERVLIVEPITVHYEIFDNQHVVLIYKVRVWTTS